MTSDVFRLGIHTVFCAWTILYVALGTFSMLDPVWERFVMSDEDLIFDEEGRGLSKISVSALGEL